MSDTSIQSQRDLDRLDVEEIKRFLARRWKLIVAIALGCAILAAIVCVALTPVYTATSQVLLDPRKQHVFGGETVNPDSVLDSSIVDSQIPIITSTHLLAKVIQKENLADDPEFAGPARRGLLDRLFGMFRARKTSTADLPSFDGIDPKLAPVILRLFKAVDVTRIAKSYVLSIAVSSRDPEKAMRLANSIAEVYVTDQVDVRARSIQQTAIFFEQRLGRLRDQVRASERAVAEFRKAHDLTTTNMDGKITVGEQQLQSLNEELAKVSADTAEKLAKYQQGVRFKARGSNLDTLPEVVRSQVMVQLRAQQADLSRREADLASIYGPAYPAITQIHAQRAGLDRAINAEIRRLTSVLKNDYEVAKAREVSFRHTIVGLSDVSGGDNEVGVKLRELERTNLANKALFENFLNRAKLAQEQSTFEDPDARLISPALEPTSPSSPKTKIILPVAAVAGLLLGLGIASLVDRRRRRVVPEVPVQNAAFILGRVPAADGIAEPSDLASYLEHDPESDFAHSIKELAAKLAEGISGQGRVITLSPLHSGEGATSLSLCLAEALGMAGRKVLLIDADPSPSRSGLTDIVGADGLPGFAEVVAGDVSASKTVARQPHFAFLPAGRKALDAATDGKALADFFKETRARFDVVLIDAPALTASANAMAMSALSDGFALVASWDQIMRETFIAAIDEVADKPNFIGIILNRTITAESESLAEAS